MKTLRFAAALVALMAGSSARAAEPPKHLVFNIMRSGSQIGQHTIDIATDGKTTTVDMTTNIDVKVMFVSAYRLTYAAREIWTDGAFSSFRSQTDDNGKKHTVNVTSTPDKVTVVADGKRSDAPKGTLPATFWNTQFTTRQNLIHTENGEVLAIKVADVGMEQIQTPAGLKPARHYRLSGGLERDMWFDQAGTPTRFQLRGSDKSIITSEAQQ